MEPSPETPATPAAPQAVAATMPKPAAAAPTGVAEAGAAVSALNGPFPAELRGWNWGAFFLNWIWGIGHNVWLALLVFVPFVGIVMPFVLGAKGNEWAWQHRKFENVEQFRAVQKAWTRWGLIIFVVSIVASIAMAFLAAMAAVNLAGTTPTTPSLY